MDGIDYLLTNINNINGIGKKTADLLKKKILTLYLIYCGTYLEIMLIEVMF